MRCGGYRIFWRIDLQDSGKPWPGSRRIWKRLIMDRGRQPTKSNNFSTRPQCSADVMSVPCVHSAELK
jgi:hypothetical protein